MISKKMQDLLEAAFGTKDLDGLLASLQTAATHPALPAEVRAHLRRLTHLETFLQAVEIGNESDLNFRYNELISEMANLVRDSLSRQRIHNELQMASAVQKALMPPPSQEYGEFSVSGRCYAAESCGGDWWFHASKGNKLLVWIGDVLGHDIAAALVASACRATVSALQMEKIDAPVGEQLSVMNNVIYSMTKGEVYLTAICLELDLQTGVAEIGCASHPPSLLLSSRGVEESSFLDIPADPPLGLVPDQTFQVAQTELKPGQSLFLMTDGLLEIPTAPHVHWREPRLVKLLSKALDKQTCADGLIQELEQHIFSIGSGELADDMTYVAVHRKTAA